MKELIVLTVTVSMCYGAQPANTILYDGKAYFIVTTGLKWTH